MNPRVQNSIILSPGFFELVMPEAIRVAKMKHVIKIVTIVWPRLIHFSVRS